MLLIELWNTVYAIGGAFASGKRYPFLTFQADLSDLTNEGATLLSSLEKARDDALLTAEEYFAATSRILLARNIGVLQLNDEIEQRYFSDRPSQSSIRTTWVQPFGKSYFAFSTTDRVRR